MIIIDLIFFGLIVLSIFIGYKRGLIKQAGNIAAVILSFIFAIKLFVPFAYNISDYIPMHGNLLKILSFLILFVAFGLLLIISVWLLERSIKSTPLVIFDKIGGILFAMLIVLIVCGIILYGLSVLPFPETFIGGLKHTFAYKIIDFIVSNPNIKHVYSK